ncbi:MAG: hypothetical protein K2X74_17500 [Acetobacteraceae bacterium]|nr:hypothetical protein [Acetobacteraceae bacterium]
MMNGSGDGARPPEGADAAGGLDPEAEQALTELDDAGLMALGGSVLAELARRSLLRVLLRNRADAATAFEVEAIRDAGDGIDLVAAGWHAETPDGYAAWVEEAEGLQERLSRPGLDDDEAEGVLETASNEALLLALESARMAEEEDEEDDDTEEDAGTDADDDEEDAASLAAVAGGSVGARIALELLRRGVIEAEGEA